VSVVIPAYNAAGDIGGQLRALAAQDYLGRFEVVVADNMSTDDTSAVAQTEGAALGLDVRVIAADGTSGVSHARNAGCAAARGDVIAVCDADDVVAERWLTELVAAARHHDLVGGSLDAGVVNTARVTSWRALPPRDALPTRYGFLPYAHGCNLAIWKDVWATSAGWDESIRKGCDDIEFAWRLQVAGHTLGVAPDAVVHYRFRDTVAGHARQMYWYHRHAGLLIRRFRPHGLRRNSLAGLGWNLVHILKVMPQAVVSDAARGLLVGLLASLWGRIRTSIEYRVWAL
jgi:glycosyltransferase involved in cell wall biosynthesis